MKNLVRFSTLLGVVIVVAFFAGSAAASATTAPTAFTSVTGHAGPKVIEAHATGGPNSGYWFVARDGGIFNYGTAGFDGSQGGSHLNAPIVGMASTPDGGGYWLVASDGGIFTHGDAGYYGSEGGTHLNSPIVGIAATPSGHGYWEVAADGGIFTFGDAGYYGSQGGGHLNQPIVGMAATPDGGGYWLVARDGGIFTHGDAGYFGSQGGSPLNAPIVGMAAAPDGGGYWLVASDGGIFTHGSAGFFGSQGGSHLNAPIVGMAATSDGQGYWFVASDGGIFTHGDASFQGSAGGSHLNQPIVGISANTAPASQVPTQKPVGTEGLASDGVDPGFDPATSTDIEQYMTDTVNSVAQYWEDNYQAWTASSGHDYGNTSVTYNWVDDTNLSCGPETIQSCGQISSPSGKCTGGVAFYCLADDSINVDVAFAYNADLEFGDFATSYIVAHEYGHNVQTELEYVLGQSDDFPNQELQADCFAGNWGNAIISTDNLTQADVNGATDLISFLGDDAISGSSVPPPSGAHGTSAQREQAFAVGFNNGSPALCQQDYPIPAN